MKHFDDYQPRFDSYRSLMPHRVREILLVSNLYDAFVLEEDGNLSEQIWNQYIGMRLTEPPKVKRASSIERALEKLEQGKFDMVLAMSRISGGDPFKFAEQVKKTHPGMPVVLLATDPAEIAYMPPIEKRTGVDHIFVWNNDPQLLLAIIKLIEDRINLDEDVVLGQVRVILMIEDSIRHASAFLPLMYKVIMDLTRSLIDSGFNHLHKQLRMRSRAKIVWCETYEQAQEIYHRYRSNVLGVISDVRFWHEGREDDQAGLEFVKTIKMETPDIPVVLQSAEPDKNRQRAYDIGAAFLDKNSPSLLGDLRRYLKAEMGFGSFVFRMPDGQVVGSARDVYSFLEVLERVPIESIIWHGQRNHFSNWLMARAEITIAEKLRPVTVEDFAQHQDVREHLLKSIKAGLREKQSDVVAEFSLERPEMASDFSIIGRGSMGGKARGIAFARYLTNKADLQNAFEHVEISVPKSLVIGADEFDDFLESNGLREFSIGCNDYDEIKKRFMEADISLELEKGLRHFLKHLYTPLAVRSSSILEDSHLQPFAGLYSTYMLCNDGELDENRVQHLLAAVKMVWASTYGPDPKAYFNATDHRLEEEKMAVIVQEMVGKQHGDYFYPTFSGVAQSYNFYPFGQTNPKDGVLHMALGLGKTVVEGGSAVRCSPLHPQVLPQFTQPSDWLAQGQRQFYALKMKDCGRELWKAPDEGLQLRELADAEHDGELEFIASTYLPESNVIRDSISYRGPRLVTFAALRKYDEHGLMPVFKDLLDGFSEGMGGPVEVEFAVNLWPLGSSNKPELKILQVRPLISMGERHHVRITKKNIAESWCTTTQALGNGRYEDLTDIVYVRPSKFDRRNMQKIVEEVGILNAKLEAEKRKYILVGFGRWGSNDPWLGIGVGWAQISNARVMVEASTDDFVVDPSHGSHFFQNITSLGIGYLTLQPKRQGVWMDWDWLESLPYEEELEYLRHVRLPSESIIKIDGRKGGAVMIKPH